VLANAIQQHPLRDDGCDTVEVHAGGTRQVAYRDGHRPSDFAFGGTNASDGGSGGVADRTVRRRVDGGRRVCQPDCRRARTGRAFYVRERGLGRHGSSLISPTPPLALGRLAVPSQQSLGGSQKECQRVRGRNRLTRPGWPIRPSIPHVLRGLALRDIDLVPEHQDLDVLVGLGATCRAGKAQKAVEG